jgi:putative phage-type endonuclease
MTIVQGSPEWFLQRLGKVTASRLADVVAKTKTGESTSRANYRAELVAERLTGKQAEGFSNAAMKWGVDCEPLARAAYEAETGQFVVETGMVHHPVIAMSGASPDGLVLADGVLEIKCPDTKTHIETVLSDRAPAKYMPQMQWQIACTGRAWCDFVSFDPRMPADMQTYIKRVQRDDEAIAAYEAEVVKFLAEVDEIVARLYTWRKAA